MPHGRSLDPRAKPFKPSNPYMTYSEFMDKVALPVEYGCPFAYTKWRNNRCIVGDYFEWEFKTNIPIPVHLPPYAMKLIACYSMDEADWDCGGGWRLTPPCGWL